MEVDEGGSGGGEAVAPVSATGASAGGAAGTAPAGSADARGAGRGLRLGAALRCRFFAGAAFTIFLRLPATAARRFVFAVALRLFPFLEPV